MSRALAPSRPARWLLWLLMALPALAMLRDTARGTLAMDLLDPSGLWTVRWLVAALLPGPLAEAFGASRWLRVWLAMRRDLGVAAFLYALLHLGFYLADSSGWRAVAADLPLPGIWTGWLALGLLLPAAATSLDRAMRALGRRWLLVQRVVYPAVVAGFAHWLLLDWGRATALVHLVPLLAAWLLRALRRARFYRRTPA